ncbi:MAG: NifU family protein [Flavobacteriales bacterium]|nr:NifU family protein [Flavobacteriales bacterium]
MAIPTSVYAEMTPNPAVMKFVADRLLIEGGYQAELRSQNEAALCSPLAEELFNFPFVTGIFISGHFVSVTKDESLGWEMIVQQLREYIREWLMENPVAIDTKAFEKVMEQLAQPDLQAANPSASSNVAFLDESEMSPSEYDDEIKDLLDEFVRPAVEQDGGAIDFKAFKEGKVYVHMRGACSGCPSSMQTLKGGIEQLLTSKIDAVEEVVALGV